MSYVAYVVTQFHMVSSDKAQDSAIVLVQAAAAMQQGSGNSAFAQACLIEPRALDPARIGKSRTPMLTKGLELLLPHIVPVMNTGLV